MVKNRTVENALVSKKLRIYSPLEKSRRLLSVRSSFFSCISMSSRRVVSLSLEFDNPVEEILKPSRGVSLKT